DRLHCSPDRLLHRIEHPVSSLVEKTPSLLLICSGKPDNDLLADASCDDSAGDLVTAGYSSKQVHNDHFYRGDTGNEPDSTHHAFLIGPAAHIKEVGSFSLEEADQVQCCHSQPCTIPDNPDISLQLDIRKSVSLSLPFAIGHIPVAGYSLPPESVIIYDQLGIRSKEACRGGH